jgi:hypothetical protein
MMASFTHLYRRTVFKPLENINFDLTVETTAEIAHAGGKCGSKKYLSKLIVL